ISGDKGVDIGSTNGTTTVNATNVTSNNGSVNITGNQGVNLGNGTNVTAKDNVTIESSNGSVNVTGTNVTTDGNINITAKVNITITNSNLSGKEFNTNATEGSSTITNNTISVTNLTVDAKDTNIFTDNNLNVTANTRLSADEVTFTNNSGIIDTNPVINNVTCATKPTLDVNPNLTITNATVTPTDRDPRYNDWLEDEERDTTRGKVVGKDHPLAAGETITVTSNEAFISTCYIFIDDILDRYHVSEEDARNLSVQEIIEKYGISREDRVLFERSCALVPNYLKSRLPYQSKSSLQESSEQR
ncbi:hypothetical protein CJP74_05085, partial [Psittacicella melopsittaci]